jgi:polar amino acid transport system permease protein
MNKGWNWDGFVSRLVNPYLIGGASQTIWLTLAAIAAGQFLGTLLTLARLSGSKWLSAPAAFYVWVFRGAPLAVQLIILYTGSVRDFFQRRIEVHYGRGYVAHGAAPAGWW